MNRIFVTGDIHHSHTINKFNSKNFPEGKELDKQDYVIIVGDFGLHWNNSKEDKYWLKWLNDKPWTTLWLDGNHENFDIIWQLPKADMFGDEVRVSQDSIFYLQRGHKYVIAEIQFFVFGGAKSIDKEYRTEGISWWQDEEPNYNDYKKALSTLKEIDCTCDFLLTHEAPSYIRDHLISHHHGEDNYQLVRFLDEIIPSIRFKHHYFGHHHVDKTIADRHTCCYNKIHELK